MRRILPGLLLSLMLLLSLPMVSAQENADSSEYGNPELLVEADWLAENLSEVKIIDLRPQEEYEAAHIPGALQLDVSAVRATVDGIRGQVADQETVEGVLRERGITPEDTLILYDDANLLDAALLFWTLEYYGHADVRLLNGGWFGWQAGDFPVSDEAPEVEASDYTAEIQPEVVVDSAWVLEHLEDDGVALIDARSRGEYSGETVRAQFGGHIPGAFNVNWTDNLEENFFLSQEALEGLYMPFTLGDAETIVAYCQTGHRASVTYFTLRLMGFEDVRVYDGSWEEWGNSDAFPHATEG